jgi:hypothetical protein
LQASEFREKGVNSSEWGAGKSLRQAAAFTGARRGELRGMFWENYRDGELLIARSIWNGITTDPKSRKSKAPIPIIPKLAAKLEAHRARLRKPKTGPIFSKRAGNEIDPDSLLRRVILPALEVCEFRSKPESEHGRATHHHERNKVLPAWCGDQPYSPGRRRFSNSANPASQQRRGYISLLHPDGERRRQSRNAETRNGYK